MKIQVTLTVEEGKYLIALGTCKHPLFKTTFTTGKILLKGGTTVSRIAKIMVDMPLRICGRITQRGTVTSLNQSIGPHCIMLEKGKRTTIDSDIASESQKMGKGDLVICGANAFDSQGNAVSMVGSAGGGSLGQALCLWYSEGIPILIPVGIEKMIPGNLDEIIIRSGRKGKELSWGMSVGLLPLQGEIITEIEAIKYLAEVECQAIGAGGIGEAQGSVTLEIWGEDSEVKKAISIIRNIKEQDLNVSGTLDSLEECDPICKGCQTHLDCGYRNQTLKTKDTNKA